MMVRWSSRMGVHGLAYVVLVALLFLAGAGCAKRESRTERGAIDSTAARPDTSEAGRAREPGPPAPGIPIERGDSLINAAAPKLAPWVAMWRRAMPQFKPESLYRVGMTPAFRKGYVQPLKNVYPPHPDKEPVYLILSDHSPDGRYNLVFDWHQSITDHGGIEIGGDADSAPLLLDLRAEISNQFESCGTPCGFDWGVWLSPKKFALAGWQEVGGTGPWRQGRLAIYSLADSTSATYVTRPVPPAAFSRYREAWKAWVISKFRGLKPSTTPGS